MGTPLLPQPDLAQLYEQQKQYQQWRQTNPQNYPGQPASTQPYPQPEQERQWYDDNITSMPNPDGPRPIPGYNQPGYSPYVGNPGGSANAPAGGWQQSQPYVGNEWQQQQAQTGPQQYKPTYGLAAQAAGVQPSLAPVGPPAPTTQQQTQQGNTQQSWQSWGSGIDPVTGFYDWGSAPDYVGKPWDTQAAGVPQSWEIGPQSGSPFAYSDGQWGYDQQNQYNQNQFNPWGSFGGNWNTSNENVMQPQAGADTGAPGGASAPDPTPTAPTAFQAQPEYDTGNEFYWNVTNPQPGGEYRGTGDSMMNFNGTAWNPSDYNQAGNFIAE